MDKIFFRISVIFCVVLFLCGNSCKDTANAAWCILMFGRGSTSFELCPQALPEKLRM